MPMPDPQTTFGGPTQAGSGQPSRLTTMGHIDDLAAWLLSPHRERIAVVASVPVGQPGPGIDAAAVAKGHADRVEVYVVAFGSLTGRLASHLPADCGLGAGGVRLYPVLRKWQRAPVAAPLVRSRVPGAAGQDLGVQFDQVLASVLAQDAVPAPQPRHPAPVAFEPDGLKRVLSTESEAAVLARFLVDRNRPVPVLVVTAHPDVAGPYVDAAALAHELKGLAAVVELTPDATYGLTNGLGDKRYSVFYGACRVYPVGAGWLHDMYRAPLHMTTSPAAARRLTPALIDDALMAAHDAGLLKPAEARSDDRQVEATVVAPLSELDVLVRLPDDAQASMRLAELRLGVPIDRLLRKGQRLAGRARRAGLLWRFFPDPVADEPDQRAQALLPEGAVVLAKVEYVEPSIAVLLVHPEVAGTMQDDSAEDLRDLLDVGDVVLVRVAWQDGELACTFPDGQALEGRDAPVPLSMPVLPDGPPWLTLADLAARGAEEPAAVEAEPPPTVELPQPVVPAQALLPDPEVATLQRQLTDAKAAVAGYEDRLRRVEQHLERVQEQAKSARAAARRSKGAKPTAPRPVYADPHRQLRHEVWLAYLERFAEPERALRVLPEQYDIGPDFVPTLGRLREVSREKVVEVMVEVLLAIDAELDGRDLHAWGESRTGPQLQRADGALAWRVALQRGAPGARRMKYWRHPGGRVEFDSVGHHDDGL
jgi:hypothetical protein